ncbi:PLC-like phosphodiesterase [Meredithblackwellia eburnea MCA 4105]
MTAQTVQTSNTGTAAAPTPAPPHTNELNSSQDLRTGVVSVTAPQSAQTVALAPQTPVLGSSEAVVSTTTDEPHSTSNQSQPVAPSSRRRRSNPLSLPPALLKPGMDMLKVSHKSARRVKTKKLWLEVPSTVEASGSTASVGGIGTRTLANVRLCWEKNWRGVGPTTQSSIPLLQIRDLRFGSAGSAYRTALHLSPSVEPRWMTIIYASPSSSSSNGPLSLLPGAFSPSSHSESGGGGGGGGGYKLLHFIAPSEDAVGLWRTVLERVKDGRGGREGTIRIEEEDEDLVDGLGRGFWGPDLPSSDQSASGTTTAIVNSSNSLGAATNGSIGGSGGGGGTEKKLVGSDEVLSLCRRLGMGVGREEVKVAFQAVAGSSPSLDFAGFQKFVKFLKRREDVEEVFRLAARGSGSVVWDNAGVGPGLSKEDWERWMRNVQESTLPTESLSTLFTKYADPTSGTIQLEGFSQFLLSSDNTSIRDESGQDMTRPLTEYFINSSHNTYLSGNQLSGEATIEVYIRALQQGCRCVELDLWNGDSGEPIVTHGRTLTSSITVTEALTAIASYAFLASVYPVILSLEIHCDTPQQDRFVEILKRTMGDRLLTSRVGETKEGGVDVLPSPWDLRGKVLLKAKNLIKQTTVTGGPVVAVPIEMEPLSLSSSTESSSSTSSDSGVRKRVIRAVRRSFDARSTPSPASTPSPSVSRSPPPTSSLSAAFSSLSTGSRLRSPHPPHPSNTAPLPSPPLPHLQHSTSISSTSSSSSKSPKSKPPPPLPMSPALASLLIYTVGTKLRGFNKKEYYEPTAVVSLSERVFTKMLKDEGARMDLVAHNRNHLVRCYPSGRRVWSTNYDPTDLWATGAQVVAMNWQRFDVGMDLNTAMFARAGRSGYVLKPEILRRKGNEKDKEALARTAKFSLALEVISAQQLPRTRESSDSDGASLDPFVEVSLYVPGTPAPQKFRTKAIVGNAFHPAWKASFTLPFTMNPAQGMLDLAFLRFEVRDAKGNLKDAFEDGKGDFVGSYSTSVGGLLPGYRHVPLYDSMGDQHLFSSLFIKSKISRPPSEEATSPPLSPQ